MTLGKVFSFYLHSIVGSIKFLLLLIRPCLLLVAILMFLHGTCR